jgi:hypothetical protein
MHASPILDARRTSSVPCDPSKRPSVWSGVYFAWLPAKAASQGRNGLLQNSFTIPSSQMRPTYQYWFLKMPQVVHTHTGGEVRGRGIHGDTGAHLYREVEVWYEVIAYVTARGYTCCCLS